MAHAASVLREIRTQLGLSQAECAKALGVAVETFRTWDSGRRRAPGAIVCQARTLKAKRPLRDLVPLQVLADELHVHVRTLRAAARDGRLAATFGPDRSSESSPRLPRERPPPRSWRRGISRTHGRGRRRPVAVCRVDVPAGYAAILVRLRHWLGLSQQELADKVGAASKAVVYQWESGKRKPSHVFWLRIQRLQRAREIVAN